MGRRGAKPKEATPPASQQEKRNPIQWSGNLDVALAHIMKENWASYQGSKNKMEVCRKWAAILHISQQDTGGEKTKAHISHLVSSYTKARELLQMTGSGSKVKEVKVNGKKMKVTVSVEDQVRQICPVYEILDTFLGTRATVVMSSTIGLGTNGLMGTLTLGGKKDEAGGDISSASEDSTNLPKSTNSQSGEFTQTLLGNLTSTQAAEFGYKSPNIPIDPRLLTEDGEGVGKDGKGYLSNNHLSICACRSPVAYCVAFCVGLRLVELRG
ncbi:hypothetical protein BDZ91DRAFT_802545 [Kalaharituber pfeilii]|nr:hypothetical protein BDZ91DRAFT_802545 [Kalaharituber pfeilii]